MASPCISVRASAFRIKRSRVPCKKIRGRHTRIESLYVTRRDCPYVCWNRVVAALECLLDGYRNTGRRAAKLIRRVKRVDLGGRRIIKKKKGKTRGGAGGNENIAESRRGTSRMWSRCS